MQRLSLALLEGESRSSQLARTGAHPLASVRATMRVKRGSARDVGNP
jgi:hypothetical protein